MKHVVVQHNKYDTRQLCFEAPHPTPSLIAYNTTGMMHIISVRYIIINN